MADTELRLILGDQLNIKHPWFNKTEQRVIYVLMEVKQETDYVLHHAQKIIAIFAAMRAFCQILTAKNHRVHYIKISDKQNQQDLTKNLDELIKHYRATRFAWQMPDEYRLDQQLTRYARALTIATQQVDSAHFYTTRAEVGQFFSGQKSWLMERFYRHMRQHHGILLTVEGRPEGDKWNFDQQNREKWKGNPAIPPLNYRQHNHAALWQEICQAGIKSFGSARDGKLIWPTCRQEALSQLNHFIRYVLPNFGKFQDAMSQENAYMFHSLLSFALNTKMLSPREVVARAEQAFRAKKAPLAAVEGFIRQVIGWREYVRGIYWAHMPDYTKKNFLQTKRKLPHYFWDGKTNMHCMAMALGQSLESAYAHHIQRLMIIGNFALLTGLAAEAVHRWYLGVYIDAFEWVEAPNTLGMSQFADGGLMASKPYVSSAAYIHRMSDYCGDCHYQRQKRHGEGACPFNALYWDFFARHRERLSGNQRLGLVYKQLDKMSQEEYEAVANWSVSLRKKIDTL